MRVSLADRFRLEGSPFHGCHRWTELVANSPRHGRLVITDIRLPDGSGAEIFELPMNFPGSRHRMTGFGSVADGAPQNGAVIIWKSCSISTTPSELCE